jgi:hypothetical protein
MESVKILKAIPSCGRNKRPYSTDSGRIKMNWPWRVGMLVLTGVPAIVGGGLCWAIFGKWGPVVAWEVVLLLIMSLVIYKGGKKAESSAH